MSNQNNQSTVGPMIIIGSLFFIFGFATWLNSLLIPYLRIACELTEVQSYFVTFAFYIAYLVMAPVSTWVLNKFGFKNGMAVSLGIMAVGALLFIPAAYSRTYILFLLGLFVMGGGLAILQTASNPYITILGPVETAAKRISIMGICNKFAGALAPIILGYFLKLDEADKVKNQLASMSPEETSIALDKIALQVVNPYIGIVVVLILLGFWISKSNLPEVKGDEEEDAEHHNLTESKQSIFDFPHVLLGFIALFAYVGVEVLAGDTIIAYGTFLGIPLNTAKFFTAFTMGSMVVGYIIGIIAIPKYLSQETALKSCAILGIILTVGIIFTDGMVSLTLVGLLGLANSLVWPAIWPLALKGVGKFTSAASGILVMGIAGGAVIPLLYGALSHSVGAHQAYWIALPCYLYILYYAVSGHKVRKKTHA
ncbi:glucose/galactose MFS transporter [Sphingobacterium mizutaii NBRC 14946 = DSM 11724]|uniref:L-fucose permease n=2 Tax=Sphingobacterium mizutaii TaxID=1010 RepID=A0AAJ4X8G0_9SPHI|nr:sugar MFS transporter [Sphingobacterium mizutaii]GEM69737.1 glucose/galactose MFS transporter [Sphingobacterium mizutaii NBRC 14946 = DSM 11724]SDL89899.1 glucose/galactose transporter [Sphingobacterium mizutaii]SNV40853.1 L-fucose permease [Sphingobacterium mizutaii]